MSGGIYEDGWTAREAEVVLDGGSAAKLILRATPVPCEGQSIDLFVDGERVASRAADGPFELRVPVPPSERPRQVRLRWAKVAQLSDVDPREAAGLLEYLNVVPIWAPAAIRIPADLRIPAVESSGIDADGWARQWSSLVLAGGPATELLIHGAVLPAKGQRLSVSVDGHTLYSEPAEAGPLNVRIGVPDSVEDRCVSLVWSATATLPAPDGREVAALLGFVGTDAGKRPSAIRSFSGFELAGADVQGLHADGWSDQAASLTLAGGPAGWLSLRVIDVAPAWQHLELFVNGVAAWSDAVGQHPAVLRVPIPAAPERRIELRWGSVEKIAHDDPRAVAARLGFIRIGSGAAPSSVRLPEDLGNPDLSYGGVYEDGWLKQSAWVELAGGDAAELDLHLHVPGERPQRLEVAANGSPAGVLTLDPGEVSARLDLPPSPHCRRIDLHWERASTISAADRRDAAARLGSLELVPRR